jgi:hypothetical protein
MSGECLYAIHGPRATGTCGCETCYFDYKHKLEEEEDTGGAAPMTWVAMIRETMEQVVPPAEMRAAAPAEFIGKLIGSTGTGFEPVREVRKAIAHLSQL